ncbi:MULTISPECIES: hypothetical protein [Arthrobacter]|uniref:Flagellar protein FliT n=2 Tax=Arthrobacter TaxID=1663 RepID=A0ABU9KIC5_9MICC|nr:hypothetical protein [Arthrobacter sp. YJM1]MDP5226348.1 hypothetical protein [Arthrobacter sp. YJM1]
MAERWDNVLDRLEADLDAAEDCLSHQSPPALGPWTPGDGLGPLPGRLAERARSLAERQEHLRRLLEEAKAATGRHLAAVRSVPSEHRQDTALYLDRRA